MSCPSCGHDNPAEARFCNACGTRLAAPMANPEPRAYTPRHLVEKILASKSALEGERKPVTVLFADVARSMELAERVDPEEWHRLLDRLFRVLADGVHRYEGTINQYTGDGIMALFGAPIAHEDHAERACAAALDLARELLDAVVERMMEAVHRYDGTVNQVMGDGIMALFGAPLACEDHAVRACFAALRMQEEFGRYAEELRRTARA